MRLSRIYRVGDSPIGILLSLFILLLSLPSKADEPALMLQLDPGGHTAAVHQILFMSGDHTMISVGDDKLIRVWATDTGQQIGTIHGQVTKDSGKLRAAALSQDEKTLAVAGETFRGSYNSDPAHPENNRVYIHLIHLDNLNTFPLQTSTTLLPAVDSKEAPQEGYINALAFSPANPNLLAAASDDNTVAVWDVSSGKLQKLLNHQVDQKGNDISGHTDIVTGVAWSPDGSKLASVSFDKTLRIWDARNGKQIKRLDIGQNANCVAWSRDKIAVGDDSGTVHIFDPGSYQSQPSFKQDKQVSALAFSADGSLLAAAEEGLKPYAVTVWNVHDHQQVTAFKKHDGDILALGFSRKGATLASGGRSADDIYLWAATDGTVKQHLSGAGGPATNLAWLQSGTADRPEYKLAWDTTNGTTTRQVFDFNTGLLDARGVGTGAWRFPSEEVGRLSVTVSDDWQSLEIRGGVKPVIIPHDQKEQVLTTAIAPNAGTVVVGSVNTLCAYDVKTGQKTQNFIGHDGPIFSVAVSPDNKYLASASGDQTVAIWPIVRQDVATDPLLPTDPLLRIFASADGKQSIAWNPKYGFYACSPKAESFFGWQKNKGDASAEYWPAGSFQDKQQPGVIQQMLITGDEIQAIFKGGSKAEPIKNTPPTVSISSAAAGKDIPADTDMVMVDVRVTENGDKINTATITDNSHVRMPLQFSGPNANMNKLVKTTTVDGDIVWTGTFPVKLAPGLNDISVLAMGQDGRPSTPSHFVVNSLLPKRQPTLNVLAVGVSKYLRYEDLDYAAADAQAIGDLFQQQEGKAFSRVTRTVLTDETPRRATKENIVAALDSLSAHPGDEEDYTIIFLAMHGGDVKTPDGPDYYLSPYDVDTFSQELVQKTALEFSNDIAGRINGLPGHIILFLDACHSTGKGDTSDNPGFARVLNLLAHRAEYNLSPIITFASCESNETSKELPEFKHGAFTQAVLQGLKGAADQDKKGKVTATDLKYYVRSRVRELLGSRVKDEGPQSPDQYGNLGSASSTVLANISTQQAALPR